MVTDRNTKLGCAISNSRTQKWNTYLLACDYAATNMYGCPVYKSGSTASSCTGGADSVFPGLCKTTENIDPNVC
jgi:hypothetical protein